MLTTTTLLTPDEIERERCSMPASVFAREYLNQFNSIENRFFSPDNIAAAFGDMLADKPEFIDDPDPALHRQRAFSI